MDHTSAMTMSKAKTIIASQLSREESEVESANRFGRRTFSRYAPRPLPHLFPPIDALPRDPIDDLINDQHHTLSPFAPNHSLSARASNPQPSNLTRVAQHPGLLLPTTHILTMAPSTFASAAASSGQNNAAPRDGGSEWCVAAFTVDGGNSSLPLLAVASDAVAR